MAQSKTLTPYLQPIASQIKRKLTLLAVGGKAPMLKLLNLKNETVTLSDYNGKFIYLSFFNSRSTDCITELDSVASMEKRFSQVLSMVSVSVDDDFENAARLWEKKGYTWELLNGSKQKQLIINYNASITPVFYLIGPKGTIQLSQTPSPSQGFEPLFIRMLRRL